MCLKRCFSLCNMGVLLLLVMMGGASGLAPTGAGRYRPAPEKGKAGATGTKRISYEPSVAKQAAMSLLANEAPFPLPALDLESQIELIAKTPHEREKSKADSLAAVVNA